MSKKQYYLSGALIILCLIASISSPIVSRWGALRSFGIELLILTLWISWVISAVCIQLRRCSPLGKQWLCWAKIVTVVLASIIAIWGASMLGGVISKALRFHEIRVAMNAGLREDCLKLLANWPVGVDRIDNFDSEYLKLPSSIRMLTPVYVLNDHLYDTNIPPNIGLCKNGWGGFAFGIRVFQSDEDAIKLKYGNLERVAPGVYIWSQDT